MKNKINKTEKKPNKIMLNKAKHKTRLTQKKSSKTPKKCKQKKEHREESDRITWSHFPSTP